ncbi:TcdA/TcdB catalytic glycosyltransferase domain-containing protein [Serratia proteamaculans]|uniref:Glycosyltransferase n=1 Tax=Serratia proteamaculans TaxID=28151 RepID=A0A5Q2V7V3_SERPR|nr:TcdA/TcdB catalytic glycosyltransferase domain-containing protein [Serratia proteamaculans]QGH60095.1 glycosyltransferase [Serratia proteamaculans]
MRLHDGHLGILHDDLFRAEYEARINDLKFEFVKYQREASLLLLERYQRGVVQLREWRATHGHLFDAARCSSLFCVPTRLLAASEKRLHRIWLGGAIPDDAREVISQWGDAQQAVSNSEGNDWVGMLWVWDARQLARDACFIPAAATKIGYLGEYDAGNHRLQVHSLSELAQKRVGDNLRFIHQLHDKRYYATLSDYFRFLILIEMGGLYMDIDTLPHRSATLFLIKPEVPDYLQFLPGGEVSHVSWLNLFLDETGMIISRKGDISLCRMLAGLDQIYAAQSGDVPDKNPVYERKLFDPFYQLWSRHIGCAFLSHDRFCRDYGVMYNAVPQAVTCGIRGMRLLEDVITNEQLPLSQDEQFSYRQCVSRLEQVDWQLEQPLDLARYAEIFTVDEVPRMAYPAQIRSDIDHYHYYSVLSHDRRLDRVNQLFGEYLIADNRRQITAGNYWCPTAGVGGAVWPELRGALHFLPGRQASETDKTRMAKLIFATSYLEYCSIGNRAGLDLVSLQQAQNIEPYLGLITVAYDRRGEFVGFFNAATISELYGIEADYHYRDEIRPLDEAYDSFVQSLCTADDYFICSLAIESQFRGQGHFNQLFALIKQRAQQHQAKNIVLCVWQRSDASQIYLNKGFRVRGVFDQAWSLFFDRLLFLEYEL